MHQLGPILKLARLDTSFLVALTVFLPILVRTNNPLRSLETAVPMLFIGVCTFIADDLDDEERDRVNHPDRPLPSGQVTPALAAALYFVCLSLALLATREFIPGSIAFWYYATFMLTISYRYIEECFPGLKAIYVAIAGVFPILIVAAFFPNERRIYIVAGAAALLVLGRELCMDLLDRGGDKPSFMHRIPQRLISIAAFATQVASLLLLSLLAHEPLDWLMLSVMAALTSLSMFFWRREAMRRRAIFAMKTQMFSGLYFLM